LLHLDYVFANLRCVYSKQRTKADSGKQNGGQAAGKQANKQASEQIKKVN
jgi:hypothetical protein